MDLPLPVLQARNARPTFSVGGKDLLASLSTTQILSFCYTDSTSDKADDITIELADPKRTWMLKFKEDIKKGTECTASIKISNWDNPLDNRVLECGSFFISHVAFKGGGTTGNVVTIKASSVPPNGIKHTKKFKAWERTDLKSIAEYIASNNGLTLAYDAKENPKVKRTEQKDKPDLEYLRDRCKEAKLSLKIHRKQLVVYDEEEYEARPAAFTLVYGSTNILDYDFNSKSDDTHKAATNSYTHPETGKTTTSKFEAPTPPEGTDSELYHNESIEFEPDDPDVDTEGENK